MTQYNFADLSFPGASQDFATGINDLGQIVGYYIGGLYSVVLPVDSGIGFLYSAGAYAAISYPFLPNPQAIADHAQATHPTAINDSGQIVGFWIAGTGYFGFLFSDGTYTNLPSSLDPFGINNAGQIVVDDFLYSGGHFLTGMDTRTTLPPLAAGNIFATDINNVGQIVGYFADSSKHAHGFIYENGAYTTLDDPLAVGTSTTGEIVGTFITGENDNGQIVGYYTDASGKEHGFLYDSGTFTTIDNPSGTQTELNGINNSGEIVGSYTDSVGHSHGFVATTDTISYAPLAYSPDAASTIVYAAEYGTLPGVTETFKLIGFTTPQYAYGQQIGVMDPALYAYQALGATLAATATHFQNTYGPSNPAYPNSAAGDVQFAADAYASVFGHPGS
jgi:probable HAF family extracellular repeat protein